MFYFLSWDPLKSILGRSLTFGLQFSGGSLRVPWLTLTEQCPLPLCSAPLATSPRLLLANSGHLMKGLVGLMVVSVSPPCSTTIKPDTWTLRRHGGLVC